VSRNDSRFSQEVSDRLQGVMRGGEADLNGLYDLTASRIYGLALRILRNEADAQEVTLDVYTRIWRRAADYDASRGSAWTLMVLITRNLAIDRLRTRRSQPQASDAEGVLEELKEELPGPETRFESMETRERIQRVFAGLPEEQREVLTLAFFEGLTHTEAAARLGQPLGTVKTRIRAGLARLRRALLDREERNASAN
jgi:RNA polymerase sigma-70 factor (ECF subfamily)